MAGEYYNTTKLNGTVLRQCRADCKTQDEQVLVITRFLHKNGIVITPESVWQRYALHVTNRVPLTSIRRSFNTLANDGWLQKTDSKVIGMYGKPVHIWIYTDKRTQDERTTQDTHPSP